MGTETFAVGKKYSMTYSACRKKFPKRKITPCEKFEDVKGIIKKGLSANKSAVLPFWNSYRGRIALTEPEKLIFDAVSPVSEIWCDRIIFVCAKRNSITGTSRKIGSAEVALQQCSKFLEKENLVNSFYEYETTTAAVAELLRGKIDLVLCGKELAEANGLEILNEDCSNPLNTTTFTEFMKRGQERGNVHLAAIEMPRLDMGRTTQAHEKIMEGIYDDVDDFSIMPKIVFAMQMPKHEDKYWLLIEFPNFPGDGSPLPPFDAQEDVHVIDRAGRMKKDFSSLACDYMVKTFHDYKWPEFAGYGVHGAYSCACPVLDIFVQGYDPDIVKDTAILSLKQHVKLYGQEIRHPNPVAKKCLNKLLKLDREGKKIRDFVKFIPPVNELDS